MSRFCLAAVRLVASFAAVLGLCASTAAAQTSVSIHDVMTNLPGGPYLGRSVSTSGIVVGVMSTGGFYISEPSGNWDNLVATAEGLPVLPNSVSACNNVAVGDVLTVVGTVTNTTPITAANTPGTGIQPTSCTRTGTGTMTQAISLSSSLASFGDALKYTGMAASNTSFYAVQPTTGTLAANSSTVTSTGQFWATLGSNSGTNNHLFRSAGIAGDEYKPSTAPTGVPTWSGNPQRILIDTTTFGGSPVDITVGQTITCAVPSNITLGATRGIGLVDYTLGYARLLIFKTSQCSVSGSVPTSVSAVADTTHFKVATLDINTFLGSASIFQTALAKAVLTVKNVFGSPDIFAMQEVGGQATLQTLADAVNTANSGSTNYIAIVPGTDTVNSGYLVNTSTLKTPTTARQAGARPTRPPPAAAQRCGTTHPSCSPASSCAPAATTP